MDLWQMILADHANIKELCREVLRATASGPNSRARLFTELSREMEGHIKAKQSVLYPALTRDAQMQSYLQELRQTQEEIRRRLDELAASPNKNTHDWALGFKELESTLRLYFNLEENGLLTAAQGALEFQEAEALRRAFEREKIALLEARRWHLPETIMPSRYGLPTGTVFGVLAGAVAVGAAVLAWRMTKQGPGRSSSLHPVHRRPEPPFPFESGVIDRRLEHREGASRTSSGQAAEHGAEAMPRETRRADAGGASSANTGFSSANPPRAPSGLGSRLQPGGMVPGGGPGASVGSIGTGGGQTENRDTGSLRRDGR